MYGTPTYHKIYVNNPDSTVIIFPRTRKHCTHRCRENKQLAGTHKKVNWGKLSEEGMGIMKRSFLP